VVAQLTVTAADFTLDLTLAARRAGWYADSELGPVVLGYRAARDLMTDPRLVQSGLGLLDRHGIVDGPVYRWFVPIILHRGGADHARLRSLARRAFSPRMVDAARGFIRATADTLAEDMVTGGDFVARFADQLPLAVICHLLGVPADDIAGVTQCTRDIGRIYDLSWGPDTYARIERGLLGLYGHIDEAIARRTAEPGDDLISALLAARADGGRLDDEELRSLVVATAFAGHDTTRCQLGQAMAVLCADPGLWRRISDDPGRAALAAEEIIRLAPAAPMVYRFATTDIDYRGLRIPAKSLVLLCTYAAHRDPAVFDRPDVVDLDQRRTAATLTFGAGAHHCLGAEVARVELAETLTALTGRFGPPAVTSEPSWRSPLGIFGPDVLPLRFAAPAPA
jgi:cytochrome P450